MYEQNTSMMNIPEQNTFLLPAMVEGDFSSEEIAEDADGLQMMSFQRVKIPRRRLARSSRSPPRTPDNPDYARTLEGVILYNHAACTLWPEGSEYDEDTKPLCSSVDGKTGIGEPGGACATCPMNEHTARPETVGAARRARICGTSTCCAAAVYASADLAAAHQHQAVQRVPEQSLCLPAARHLWQPDRRSR
ncbi:MAG: hypothetical protein ACLVD8_25860 [Enterocloster sp.]|uniref:hypothetical protein n=1 Tax=Enterocloster sp. TaxID=2719315 RepID=UPI00399B6EC1